MSKTLGLDFVLQSSSTPGFSNLDIGQFTQSLGVNYRLTNELMLNTMVEVSRYDDRSSYLLIDQSGRYVNGFVGVSWIF